MLGISTAIAQRLYSGITLGMGSANERQSYIVTLSLIGWAHSQNFPDTVF